MSITDLPAVKASTGTTVGEVLLHYLALEGVTHVFGIPGGGLANLLTTFKNSSIQYVICRHESGAAYLADGYYRSTGRLSVVMVTSGPGATNALTGVMNASNDGSALMLITGEVNESYFGMGYLQEGIDSGLDIEGVYKAATGYSTTILDASNFEVLLKQSLRNAMSLPRQAVHVSIPNNVTTEILPSPQLLPSVKNYRSAASSAPCEEVRTAMQALTAARWPLILLGNGCREAMKTALPAFISFVEYYGIPVITTADAKGIFPESHPFSLRSFGIADCMWPSYWMRPDASGRGSGYDGLLVLGSSLGDLATNKWIPWLKPADGPLIQVDLLASVIGRAFPVTQGIVAEAGAFIQDMEKLIPDFAANEHEVNNRKAVIQQIKQQHSPFLKPDQYNATTDPIEPAAIMKVLQDNLPKDQPAKIFLDAGNCVGWGIHYLTVDPPWSIYSALSMGPMGFAVGAVIGAKLGCPAETCISIVGDGAFMMYGAEVSTAKQYALGVIWIVLYDNNFSMVSQGQQQFFPDEKDPQSWEKQYELGDPDLAKYAEALGAQSYAVYTVEDMANALQQALKGASEDHRPQAIIVHINRASVPPYYNPLYTS